ncbi:MAG: GNAT family N-acetyltransferase [Candidatus Ozemobacteraceae bacterium]
MRRNDKAITDPNELARILRSECVMHLAMYDGAEPFMTAVNYGYDGKALYFHSALEGRKVEIFSDPRYRRICFMVDCYEGIVEQVTGASEPHFTARFESVLGWGCLTREAGPESIRRGLNLLVSQASGKSAHYTFPGCLEKTAVFRLDIETMTGKRSPATNHANHFSEESRTLSAIHSEKKQTGKGPFEVALDGFEISTDPFRLDTKAIHAYLSRAHWSRGIPLQVVATSLERSLCFGLYDASGSQVGLARVITDYATFAYLCDVYTLEGHRGKGLGKWLMECVMQHPDLRGVRRFMLVTPDAHGLYRKNGFEQIRHPENYMEIHRPDIYRSSAF